MVRKVISVLLCVALTFALSINVFASDIQAIPFDEENYLEIENQSGNAIVPLAQTSGIISGGVYRIKNVASGKYMNADYGIDADGTNIYQWTGDGSTEQKFKVVYSSSSDSYLLYAMCSSNGTNRVADVYDHGGVLVEGSNIKLNEPDEPPSQQVQIISVSSGKYRIAMKQNNNYVFTSYGTSNGSANGTTSTSAGNIFISAYTGSTNQQWQFELLQSPYATPIGYLDEVSSSVIRGWAYRSDIPNTALEVHIYIINNSTSEQTVYTTTANLYRSDLQSAGYGNGYHAFSYSINWKTFKPGTYTVRAYAIGAGGNNPQLTNSPKTFTVRPMYGAVDGVGNNITGWVWKPDAPNSSVQAHIYIYRPNGEQVFVVGVNANNYRSDVASAGYGTGYYGFSYPIDWSSLPEERLRVVVYAVDGSGTHPSIYSGYYENRMPITLLGMIDEKGIDHSTWIWESNTTTYCENIGCSQLNRYNYADATNVNYSYSRFIKESSFCAIATHGNKYGIQWSMRNIYNGHDDCDDTCTTCFGNYNTTILNTLSDDYFADTRCVVSIACETAKGGGADLTNFVNVLQSKGVKTVVGFEEKTWFFYNTETLQTITTQGSFKWMNEFVRLLSEGYTVDYSVAKAYEETLLINLAAAGYTEEQYESGDIPEDVLIEEVICGLDSYCVVGDGSQVIKH